MTPIDTDAREALRYGGLRNILLHARAGHPGADLALRQLAAEMIEKAEPMPRGLRQFTARALVRGQPK